MPVLPLADASYTYGKKVKYYNSAAGQPIQHFTFKDLPLNSRGIQNECSLFSCWRGQTITKKLAKRRDFPIKFADRAHPPWPWTVDTGLLWVWEADRAFSYWKTSTFLSLLNQHFDFCPNQVDQEEVHIVWHWEGKTHRHTPLLWAKIGIWKAIVEKVPLENIVLLWIRFPPYISILFLQHFCSAPNWKVRCPVLILRAGSGFEKAFRLSPSQPAHLHMVCSERSVSVQQLVFASCHVRCSCCLAD